MTILRVFFLIFFCACFSSAYAEKRVALVIGNADYNHVSKLRNPINDAKALRDAFTRNGFDVTYSVNLSLKNMLRKIRQFGRKASRADIAVIYFSGHGIQLRGINYLIPVDAELRVYEDLRYEAVNLSEDVIKSVSGAKEFGLIILDASRVNPFPMPGRRGFLTENQGLAPIETTNKIAVAFAATPGTVSFDGAGANSLYTKVLLKHIFKPIDLRDAFHLVNIEVFRETNLKQSPWIYSGLGRKEYSLGKKLLAHPQECPPQDEALWKAVQADQKKYGYEYYLKEFPDGCYAAVAKYILTQPAAKQCWTIPVVNSRSSKVKLLREGEQFEVRVVLNSQINDFIPPGTVLRQVPSETNCYKSIIAPEKIDLYISSCSENLVWQGDRCGPHSRIRKINYDKKKKKLTVINDLGEVKYWELKGDKLRKLGTQFNINTLAMRNKGINKQQTPSEITLSKIVPELKKLISTKAKLDIGTTGGNVKKIGDEVIFKIESSIPGQLIVLDVNADGKITQIFPNKYVLDQKLWNIRENTQVLIPNTKQYGIKAFVAREPAGTGFLVGVIAPLDFNIKSLMVGANLRNKGFVPEEGLNVYISDFLKGIKSYKETEFLFWKMFNVLQKPKWAFSITKYEIQSGSTESNNR